MRLIDADALIERIGEWMPHDKCGEEDIKDVIYAEACVDLIDVIKDAPTVEPKTGKWFGAKYDAGLGLFICDNCGKFSFVEYDFCPNCGADMRGEENDS